MKKIITKQGWCLGLLVGLVMLVGVAPAMAGTYNFVADLYGNDINDQYYYSKTNDFYIDGTEIDFYDKYDISTPNDIWTGSWDSSGHDIQFFVVKGGNPKNGKGYIALNSGDTLLNY